MKLLGLMVFLIVLAFSFSCQKTESTHDSGHGNHEAAGGNQKLYDEVMGVHDEVMPKMTDIYKLKEELKKQIANEPDMAASKKEEIKTVIVQLDSASESMMVWMRNFDPIADSVDADKARQYLEEQKVKVEAVKARMLAAIEEAKKIN